MKTVRNATTFSGPPC